MLCVIQHSHLVPRTTVLVNILEITQSQFIKPLIIGKPGVLNKIMFNLGSHLIYCTYLH